MCLTHMKAYYKHYVLKLLRSVSAKVYYTATLRMIQRLWVGNVWARCPMALYWLPSEVTLILHSH